MKNFRNFERTGSSQREDPFPEKIRLAPTDSKHKMDRRVSEQRDCPKTEKSALNPLVRLRD